MKQVKFRIDYSGGWGSHRKAMWKGFRNVCGPYEGPELRYLVAACTAPDGSHWAVQKWRRRLPNFGLRPTAERRAVEMHLSHWSGDLPEFVVKVDWVYERFDHLYGWLTYKGKGVYGFKATRYGVAARHLGPQRHGRHVQLELRPRLEARERVPDASRKRSVLLRLLPAREPDREGRARTAQP